MFPPSELHEPDGPPTRAGYVALVGRPNAGKSTLLNAMVGEKLSIVTEKAQTTWTQVTGILTTPSSQLIFLDTPGLLEPREPIQESMLATALDALREADVVLLVVDARRRPRDGGGEGAGELRETLSRRGASSLVAAVNKIDVADPETVDRAAAHARDVLGASVHRVSALTGDGVDDLRAELEEHLPPSPFLYPADQLASQPVRFFVAELVRETVFEQFREEIPYSVICRIQEYREAEEPVYIRAVLYVERDSQKGILVGKGGRAIRRLGAAAREKIEAFVGEQVYLDLWVKVLPRWRRKKRHLERLGFSVPAPEGS